MQCPAVRVGCLLGTIHNGVLATGVVTYEYVNGKRREAAKAVLAEKSRRHEMEKAAAQRRELLEENERQNRIIQEISNRLEIVEAELYQEQLRRKQRSFFGLISLKPL